MQGKSIYKVPNGKLIKVFLRHFANRIDLVQFTGDFFIYPEESITTLEQSLVGTELEAKEIIKVVTDVKGKNNLTFFGIDEDAIATAILMAKDNAVDVR